MVMRSLYWWIIRWAFVRILLFSNQAIGKIIICAIPIIKGNNNCIPNIQAVIALSTKEIDWYCDRSISSHLCQYQNPIINPHTISRAEVLTKRILLVQSGFLRELFWNPISNGTISINTMIQIILNTNNRCTNNHIQVHGCTIIYHINTIHISNLKRFFLEHNVFQPCAVTKKSLSLSRLYSLSWRRYNRNKKSLTIRTIAMINNTIQYFIDSIINNKITHIKISKYDCKSNESISIFDKKYINTIINYTYMLYILSIIIIWL